MSNFKTISSLVTSDLDTEDMSDYLKRRKFFEVIASELSNEFGVPKKMFEAIVFICINEGNYLEISVLKEEMKVLKYSDISYALDILKEKKVIEIKWVPKLSQNKMIYFDWITTIPDTAMVFLKAGESNEVWRVWW